MALKITCVVCGQRRIIAYQGDTGPVCEVCAAVEAGLRKPEK